jgi:hypothetical protein
MTDIIIPIQVSIIGEAKLTWVSMKKMQQKSKRIQIYTIEYKLPLKPSHKDGKHQFSPAKQQSEKNQGV